MFAVYGIPDAHLFTNCNDRVVFIYSQPAEDQTAYEEGSARASPFNLPWEFDTIVITDTSRWNLAILEKVIARMERYRTKRAYILLEDASHCCYATIQSYSLAPPYRVRPIGYLDSPMTIEMLSFSVGMLISDKELCSKLDLCDP